MVKFLSWAISNNVEQFIYASSGAVYPKTAIKLVENHKIHSNQIKDFYSLSKYSGELVLNQFTHYFKSIAILRPFFIYGIHQEKDMLIPRLVHKIFNNEIIKMPSKNGILINPIFAVDAAELSSRIIGIPGMNIYNIAGKEILTIKKICEMIGANLDKKPVFEIQKQKSYNLVADIELMENELGSPSVQFSAGLELLINNQKL